MASSAKDNAEMIMPVWMKSGIGKTIVEKEIKNGYQNRAGRQPEQR